MPPKAKFTEEEIVEAAVNIAREKGIGAVTAREVGAALGVSSRPLFTYFSTVDELKRKVFEYTREMYRDVVREGLKKPIPALGVGQQYLRFAREEPQLYRLLPSVRSGAHIHEFAEDRFVRTDDDSSLLNQVIAAF